MFLKKTYMLILIFSIILCNSVLAPKVNVPLNDLKTGSGEFSNPILEEELVKPTNPTTIGNIPTISSETTSIITPSGTVSNIAGSYNLLLLSGSLVAGVIISSADNNAIPTLNPLTGDVVVYNMDLGDSVTIDYTREPAYKAEMSKDVEAEVKTPNRVRFTAYGDDSLLKIKPSEEPSYEFKNGLLEYENDKILEQINTTRLNDASLDQNYETGFKCLTLAANANYNYNDKINKEKSFSIKNLNNQDYKVCIRKTIYDEYELVNQRYSLIDLIKDSIKLKAKVQYSRDKKLVYESLDERNDAEIATSLGITKMLIANKLPSSETISKIHIGNHVIIEKLENSKVTRYHEYSKEKYPEIINAYSTDFKTSQPDIEIKNNVLVQQGDNRFTALLQENNCLDLQIMLSYEEDGNFYEAC